MEPIREAEMQTQPGKRLNEESKKSGKGPLLIAVGVVAAGRCWRLFAGLLCSGSCQFTGHFFSHTATSTASM